MFGKCKHRDANVREYKVLGQKVEQLKDLFGALSRVLGQIVVGVVSLADATKQYGHHAGQLRGLGQQKCAVAHEHKQRRLQQREITNARKLGQVWQELRNQNGLNLYIQ